MRAAAIAAVLVTLAGIAGSNATDVYLGDENRGPADSIVIGGITFSGESFYGGSPCSVSGSGMGSALVGPFDSVDGQWHFSAGQLSGSGPMEALSLSVGAGITLDSITIVPHFSASGYTDPSASPFTMSLLISAHNAPTSWSYYTVNDGERLTLSLHSDYYDIYRVDLALGSDGENDSRFHTYRTEHGTPESIFQFGFTIESMHVTIIPEPHPANYLTLGLSIFWLQRRTTRATATA
jgi:hypothetical protein